MTLRILWVGFYTLFLKETCRFFRTWKQGFVPPFITAILYFPIFGKVIGSPIGAVDGISYIQFIVPGMVMMQVMMAAYMNATFSLYFSKYCHSIDQVLMSPMPMQVMLLAYILSSMLRSFITGVSVIVVGLLFTHLYLHHLWITLLTFLLTSMLFSMLGLINAIYAKSFDSINIIPTFVITPLTYLGGVFYSIHSLSGVWQSLSLLNPVIYIVNAFRYGILGMSDVAVKVALLGLFVLVVVVYGLCLAILRRGAGLKK